MKRDEFNVLMDQVIERTLLPGNCAQEPKKQVRIMVCADFEDSSVPEEKFFHWTPVPLEELPPFRLCHPKYWEESIQTQSLFGAGQTLVEEPQSIAISRTTNKLRTVFK